MFASHLLRGSSAGPALWTPAALGASLIGWWDYSDASTVTHSGSTLTSVADKSGNSFTLTRTGSATWSATGGPNAEGVVNIAGGYLEGALTAGLFDPGLTFVSVWEKVGAATSFNSGPLNRVVSNLPAPFDAWGTTRYTGDGTFGGLNIFSGYPDLASNSLFTSWNILTQMGRNDPPFRYYERINGTAINNPTISAISAWDDTATVITAASRADHATSANMLIGEQVAAVGLTDSNVSKLEGYCAWKWNLVSALDSGHTYKSAPPTL